MWRFDEDLSQRLLLIDDFVAFVFVAVVDEVAAAELDIVVSAAVTVIVFHLVVIVLVLFVDDAVISDIEIDDGDSAVA